MMGAALGDIFPVTAMLCVFGAVLALGLPARPAASEARPRPNTPRPLKSWKTTAPIRRTRPEDAQPREPVGQRTG